MHVNSREAVELETAKILSLLAEARALTISAKGGTVYGVHFESQKEVLFSGAAYPAGNPSNRVRPVHDDVRISSILLSGGGSDVVFNKFTGATSQSGTLTLTSVRDAAETKTITITATGVAYSQ
jgi:hypothetical protein